MRLQGHGYVVGPATSLGGPNQVKPCNNQAYQPYQTHTPMVQAPPPQPQRPLQGISMAAAGAAAASAAVAAACRGGYERRPTLRDRARFVQPLSMEDVEREPWSPGRQEMPGSVPEPHLMPPTPDTPGFPKWSTMTNQMEAPHVQNTFLHYHIPPTPTPQQGRSQSLPRNMRTEEDWTKSDALNQHPANRLMTAAAAAAELPQAPKARPIGYGRAICLADLL